MRRTARLTDYAHFDITTHGSKRRSMATKNRNSGYSRPCPKCAGVGSVPVSGNMGKTLVAVGDGATLAEVQGNALPQTWRLLLRYPLQLPPSPPSSTSSLLATSPFIPPSALPSKPSRPAASEPPHGIRSALDRSPGTPENARRYSSRAPRFQRAIHGGTSDREW